MQSLKTRISRLEEARQQRQGLFTAETTDGHVSARGYHSKRGCGGVVWYDSLVTNPKDALAAIAPQLPPGCAVAVLPRPLTMEQWAEAAYAWRDRTETLHYLPATTVESIAEEFDTILMT